MCVFLQEDITSWRFCPYSLRCLSLPQMKNASPDEAEFVICDYTIPYEYR